MPGFKVIHDSVHGSVRLDGIFLDILERPEMQRLHGVHQLGLAHLVFPGANHTRLEHSLGTYHIAGLMANSLELQKEERDQLLAAALLHDVGHPPFSHTLEEVILARTGMDHVDLSKKIILGMVQLLDERDRKVVGDLSPIADLLEKASIDPGRVCDLIATTRHLDDITQETLPVESGQAHFGGKSYLRQMISGPVDADQMDYLLRDAYYTGVAHGTIDLDRLMQTIALYHGDLMVTKGGVVAVEGLLVARALMYTSVYFHKTVRIAEMMLCKAVELAPKRVLDDIQIDTDCTLTDKLLSAGGASAKIMTMLRYRHLYKKAIMIPVAGLSDEQIQQLVGLSDYGKRKAKEQEIAEKAGISQAEVILDIPEKALLISEPRIGKTDVGILDGDRVKPLSRYSPLAKALQSRGVHDWAVMVSTPAEHRQTVEKAAVQALFP